MKLAERMFMQDGKLVVQETHDPTPTLQLAADLRSSGNQAGRESKLVAVIPAWMQEMWATEAGVKWGTPEFKEVMKRKILSGEYARLRVWEGTY